MYPTNVIQLPSKAELFYRNVLRILNTDTANILIGGSLALAHYMHLPRCPKDMDIFLTREHCDEVLEILNAHGYETEVLHPHWLAKAYKDDFFIDFIFSSGNGIAQVDDEWFAHTREMELFGLPVRICAPEEIIWSKAFIMDRERFDGADIAHLIHDASKQIDWVRLLKRFGEHWRVLLAHLLLFQYVYPTERARVPSWVMETLLLRTAAEQRTAPMLAENKLCRGTLLSRDQYLSDLEMNGYSDGRVEPSGRLSEEEVLEYTQTFRNLDMRKKKQADNKQSNKQQSGNKQSNNKQSNKRRTA
jgi:hypothetical protein